MKSLPLVSPLDKHKWHGGALGERRGSKNFLFLSQVSAAFLTPCKGAGPIMSEQGSGSLPLGIIVEAESGVITLSNWAHLDTTIFADK